jgi:hypothetical protein
VVFAITSTLMYLQFREYGHRTMMEIAWLVVTLANQTARVTPHVSNQRCYGNHMIKRL